MFMFMVRRPPAREPGPRDAGSALSQPDAPASHRGEAPLVPFFWTQNCLQMTADRCLALWCPFVVSRKLWGCSLCGVVGPGMSSPRGIAAYTGLSVNFLSSTPQKIRGMEEPEPEGAAVSPDEQQAAHQPPESTLTLSLPPATLPPRLFFYFFISLAFAATPQSPIPMLVSKLIKRQRRSREHTLLTARP